ncbi:hypothetical protein [Pseudomonas lini]|uniref:Uncharacterized protein n=1 Tax=Pseudomonas lini TaxID=163011 RepID=A0A0J6HKP6_9PSED|nr:hypothetical protein [Pseudomonas lini]KAB0502819.1 hypothetical protein F7R14_19495 [Pseudomonas lini]KMM94904.1 hypothetical protein TU81_00260 [Pseudomonas lini]SDT20789.1 hypothetical protein SAMN04490191_3500 [Pseudomonas lini]
MKDKENRFAGLAGLIVQPSSIKTGIISESLSFEDCIIQSSKHSGSFSREWVESEVEKSADYFTKEIYSRS